MRESCSYRPSWKEGRTYRRPDFPLLPLFPRARQQYSERLNELAVEASIYCNQSYEAALKMTPSSVSDYFNSKAFTDWKKGKDAETKLQVAVIERLDGVIKSLHAIGKSRR